MNEIPETNQDKIDETKLIESLEMGAQDMLATEVVFEPKTEMTTIEIPDPSWA